MTEDDINFIRSLEHRNQCSNQEAERLRNLYGILEPVRVLVLNSTCGTCVSEMFQYMVNYINTKPV